MSNITVGIDLSCLMPRSGITGVGYYTLNLMRAFLARDRGIGLRVFASGARKTGTGPVFWDLVRHCEHGRFVRWPTRLKIPMWTRLEWPPIERFTGPVDIAHGAFHLLPPSRDAKRMATVFDLTNLRYPQAHLARETKLHARMLGHAARRADALLAISRNSAQDLVELLGADPDKVHVVYGGVSMDEFAKDWDQAAVDRMRQRLGINPDYFIHLGTIEPRKNIPRLLEAYARIRERFADCPQLVLAGKKGWMFEPVFQAIESLGLGDHVVHTGYLSRDDAVCLLRGAYACLYPSLYEGFGLPVLEAMAARTPVLTSSTSSLPEVIGDTGIQVDPENVDAIEAGIARLLEHRDDARKHADDAYERAKTFTWESSADALEEVYRKLAP